MLGGLINSAKNPGFLKLLSKKQWNEMMVRIISFVLKFSCWWLFVDLLITQLPQNMERTECVYYHYYCFYCDS